MVFSKLFGTKSEREINKLSSTINRINQLFDSLSNKTDEDLLNRTNELKDFIINTRYEKEKSLSETFDKKQKANEILKAEQGALDLIMEEAFGLVKETCRRMCGTSWHVSGQRISW